MLGKKQKKRQSTVPSNAPITAFEKARLAWFEVYGSAVVEKNRYFVLLFVAGIMIVVLGFAIAAMLPLKKVVPYYIRVADNGTAVVDQSAANGESSYKPGEAEKKYFLATWVRRLMEMDPNLTKKNIQENYLQTSGKATAELTEYLKEEKPIEQLAADTSLTQTVKINGITFLQDDAALVKVSTEKRNKETAKVQSWLVTLHFIMVPPTDPDEILKNPLGLYVTHFDVSADVN